MYNKIITILFILSLILVGCGGAKPFKPTKLSNNLPNDDIEYVENVNNIQKVNTEDDKPSLNNVDSTQSANTANGINNVQSVNNVQVQNNRPTVERHNPVYKSYTVREVGSSGPREVLVTVDVSSWKMEDFIKNNKPLAESFLRKVKSGSQKIRGNNGRIRFFFDSNGDVYGVSRYGQKIIYKKYIGAVLVKHTDPDYKGIHGKYVIGILYKIMVKDRRVTEQFEYHRLPEVGEYEILVLDQDKTNVPNTKTIYMDSYRLDTQYDLNPDNFYNDLPRIGGKHKRTRMVPQNWREYIFSN